MAIDNRRARFEYDLQDHFTAGLALQGWEVKSLRAGHANLRSAWVSLRNGEAWLENCSITRWKFSNDVQEESRSRKLLLQKRELRKIENKTADRGTTIIPLKIFDEKGHLKCEIAIARGRAKHEKKQVLKERSMDRTARQAMKNFNG